MANTYMLGGSPLGLIGVKSRTDINGQTTFNAGKSRNINVFQYNRGDSQPTGIKMEGKDEEAYAPVSLLSGGSLPNFWPNADVGKIGAGHTEASQGIPATDQKAFSDPAPGIGVSSHYHNDTSYDTSVLNILEKLSKSQTAALRPQDFAYCKYLGVYPNNRLVIARRFQAPVKDNIFGAKGNIPKAILITWRPETEDFLE